MNTSKSLEPLVEAICDRLCLNYELFVEYQQNPLLVIKRFVVVSSEQSPVLALIKSRMDKVKLESHWKNKIACACRDEYYQIPN